MNRYVLDAWAWLALIQDEPGCAPVVEGLLEQAERREALLFVSIINAGEVYYRLKKANVHRSGTDTPEYVRWRETIHQMPVEVVVPTSGDVWHAADFKSRFHMSYADGFAAALAQQKDAVLVTGDQDFTTLAGVIRILWLQRTGAQSSTGAATE